MIYYDHYDGISLFRLLKYNHSFEYIYIYIVRYVKRINHYSEL